MRHRSFIAVACLLLLLVAGSAAILVLDARARDRIAPAVRVGGVELGGLTPAAARARLHARLLAPLGAPITVRRGGREFHLSTREARIHANLSGMVEAAMAVSHRGGVLTRAWHELRHTPVRVNLPARVAFSHGAVSRLVTRVQRAVDRAPADGRVTFSADGIRTVASRPGVALEAQQLEDRILAAVATPGAPRTFVAHARTVRPQVSTAQLADRYPVAIIVDRAHFRLRLYKRLQLAKTYPVAVGRQGLETPAGLYSIQDKQVNPSWHVPNSPWAGDLAGKVIPPGPDDPIKARWMGFNGGAGIHGTDEDSSIGSAASHGCIRMHIKDVIDLYPEVPVGAPIYVA